ncbi:helix-turn-helix domain-containing protein [Micromonospora haikouensis]|uniref:helix-turn-helix domain-containing protein n=1 Tax=Micromonospora haikouensis TaxID=686309 RepID=UPI0037A2FA20
MAQSASSDPRVRMFALFIKRTLADAKDRGISIDELEERIRNVDPQAKVGRSTIYRWRRAEVESPGRKQVFAFCDALGVPRTTPAQILGWDGEPASPEPDPSIDPDLRAVMRKLNDPKVSTEAKKTIRQMLRYLAREE